MEGTEYRLAAWVKESNSTGNKFLSLKLSLPQEQAVPAGASSEANDFDF